MMTALKNTLAAAAAVAVLTLSSLPARAGGGLKTIQMGVRAGLQTQNVNIKGGHFLGNADHDFGYQFGVMSRISLPGFFLQPELMYSSHKFDMNLMEGSTKVKLKGVEVPVMVGFKVLFVSLYAGPVFNLLTETVNKDGHSQMQINSDFFRSTVSYQLGAGVEFGKLTFDIRYGGQFKRSIQTISVGDNAPVDVKMRMNQWQFTLGYFF